ncbi:hypothetical protein LX32DRAFT_149393 [Colletotrichum zoysiae]|uniref:Uncharacterized protein n=1 Tax=Colletotrichum zoysiae TaxID=1216348 RepID=A0AAD9H6E8_9PEZI|nr:hypothetical protein LX32DRAFT_149393 [Colletotrichum zoysiae]
MIAKVLMREGGTDRRVLVGAGMHACVGAADAVRVGLATHRLTVLGRLTDCTNLVDCRVYFVECKTDVPCCRRARGRSTGCVFSRRGQVKRWMGRMRRDAARRYLCNEPTRCGRR